MEPGQAGAWQALLRAVEVAGRAEDVPSLVLGLLDLLAEVTGLETTYLTRIEWDDAEQVVELVHDVGGPSAVVRGLVVEWGESLCEASLQQGGMWNSDVPGTWGDRAAARDLGIVTYVSVPVHVGGGQLPYGTLCGASPRSVQERPEVLPMLRVFALLIGDAIGAERLRADLADRATHAEALLATRVRLTATAEHALRTPLLVVEGWARRLRGRPDMAADERDEGLAAIERASGRVLAQLDDLVESARATFRSGPTEPVDVAVLAEGLRPAVGDGRSYEVSGGLVLDTDRDALAVLVEHLVENALSHTPPDTPVRVRVGSDRGGPWIVVEDDGPGLPDRDDLFDPFVSADPARPGTGLGLHVVQAVAEQLGGSVEAGAAASGGARFTVRLPA